MRKMSDGPNDSTPPQSGSVSVALQFDDPDQARRCFDALATNGKVVQPLMDAPWVDVQQHPGQEHVTST